MSEFLFEARNVRKTYPGVTALDGVSLKLRAGEIHALLGENGAGKSSLIKMIAGVHAPDGGTLHLSGEQVEFANPSASMQAGVGVVHQERNLVPRYSIAENLFLDRIPTKNGLIQRNEMRERAARWLERLELDLNPDTPVQNLSVAHMQMIEIGRALSLRSRILVLDEPTASITGHEADLLFRRLHQLRDEGVAILFVSHKLEEVLQLCDRFTVLRDGKLACEDQPIAGATRDDLVRHMVGRDGALAALADRATEPGKPKLELRNLCSDIGHSDINLTLRAGEIVGLYGLVGSGRSELAHCILGRHCITSGSLQVNGQQLVIRNMRDALRRAGIGYVSEDRKSEGLILSHSVARNTAVTVWHKIAQRFGVLWRSREDQVAQSYVDQLSIVTPHLDQNCGNLSGGNQQKISIAKWLAADLDILIIDEPTVGVDIRTKSQIHRLIWELAGQGVAILLITSDLHEMVQLADRINVMARFRLQGEVLNSRDYDTTSHAVMGLVHADPTPGDAIHAKEA